MINKSDADPLVGPKVNPDRWSHYTAIMSLVTGFKPERSKLDFVPLGDALQRLPREPVSSENELWCPNVDQVIAV